MATAKPCVQRNCGMPVKKAAVLHPIVVAGAESGNHAADNRLHNAYPAFLGIRNLTLLATARRQNTPEHADNHHTVDAGHAAVQMNKLKVTLTLGMYASELQQLPTQRVNSAGHGPEGAGNAEIVGGKDPAAMTAGTGDQNLTVSLFEILP